MQKMNANEMMIKIQYYADCYARYHMAKFYNQNPEQIVDSFNKAEAELKSMLRQQQAEIEALKAELESCKTIITLANIAWERKHGKELGK